MGNSLVTCDVARSHCRTPGTIYGTQIDRDSITLRIDLPVKMLKEDAEPELIADLHKAILPVMERVFRDRWALLAGRKNPRLGTARLPLKWSEL